MLNEPELIRLRHLRPGARKGETPLRPVGARLARRCGAFAAFPLHPLRFAPRRRSRAHVEDASQLRICARERRSKRHEDASGAATTALPEISDLILHDASRRPPF